MGKCADCSPEERRLIQKLNEQGKSLRQIGEIIGCSENMVAHAIKSRIPRKKRGVKRKTTPQTDRHIVQIVKKDPFKTSFDVKTELNLEISARTVRRRLVEHNLHGRSALPVLLLSKKKHQRKTSIRKRSFGSEW